MDLFRIISRDNCATEEITKEEFIKLRNELDEKEFKRYYYRADFHEGGGYYKRIFPTESELQILLTDKINKNIKDIKDWVTFFGIITILGIVGSIIYFIFLSNQIHGLH